LCAALILVVTPANTPNPAQQKICPLAASAPNAYDLKETRNNKRSFDFDYSNKFFSQIF
jgi:hypothetical protein